MIHLRLHGVLLAFVVACLGSAGLAQPIPVELVQNDDGGWQLLRSGEPYWVNGAGGAKTFNDLAAAGGNSFRTWSSGDNLGPFLDQAQALGLTVAAGINLPRETRGFDYTDAQRVAGLHQKARQAVLRYKDHPALLVWTVGNEMEWRCNNEDAIWRTVNSIAELVKELDPNHPTMTVIAGMGENESKIAKIHSLCPAIDIIGVNSYGATSVASRYRATGATKPYMITEFGQPGPWAVDMNSLGARTEETSSQSAGYYRKTYEGGIEPERGKLCLGSYAFCWGVRGPGYLPTWLGTFLRDGSRLEAVDVMMEHWTGSPPANRCPTITPIAFVGSDRVDPGATVQAIVAVADPENDPLAMDWVLVHSATQYPRGTRNPKRVEDAVIENDDVGRVTVKMPAEPGLYRLFAFARDGQGGAAVTNAPILVGPLDQVAEEAGRRRKAHW